MKKATDLIETRVNLLMYRYDPENEIVPGAPVVTYSDRVLLSMVEDLAKKIDELEGQITSEPMTQVEAIQAAFNCLRMALGDWYEFDLQHQPDMVHFQCKRAIEFVEYAMRSAQ